MPNLLFKDVVLAMSFVLPWKWGQWKKGPFTRELEQTLKQWFDGSEALLFDSGRTSLQIALEALGVQSGDEVLVQAYTCCVVSNAIVWTGAKPVYVDITNEFNMDPIDLEKKISPRSKVLIIQHTFGIPADLSSLLKIAREHNLKIIEDCAHVLGASYKGKMLGTFGDIGMLSFGTDKAISAGRGGALITTDKTLINALKKAEDALPQIPSFKILQQLITFKLFFALKPLYNIGVGKLFFALFKKIRLLSRIIEPSEKRGQRIPWYPSHMPNALARIALHQLKNLESFNVHRQKTAQRYFSSLNNPAVFYPNQENNWTLLRFPLRVKNPARLHQMARKEGILLGDWYNTVIAPKDTDLTTTGYISGSCPNAEKLASESINLPTSIHITPHDQERIIALVNRYAD